MEIYWDCIFFAENQENAPLQSITLVPAGADHHYRGFSRLYRKGGRYGPHWFDYNTVSEEPRWRDLTGRYTRFGDVTELLLEADNRYIVANSGEETTIEFDASVSGDPVPGWKRDFLIYTVGWVKDGDLNTATGQTVDPLPFHGMGQYPIPENKAFPEAVQESVEQYNTRIITTSEFRDALRSSGKNLKD
jgi:hypothetical protein